MHETTGPAAAVILDADTTKKARAYAPGRSRAGHESTPVATAMRCGGGDHWRRRVLGVGRKGGDGER